MYKSPLIVEVSRVYKIRHSYSQEKSENVASSS